MSPHRRTPFSGTGSIPALISAAICILFLLTTISCSGKKEHEPQPDTTPQPTVIHSKNELIPYLDSLERRYEAACAVMGLANWNSYSKEAPYNLDAAKNGFSAIFNDSVARAIVEEWRKRSSSLADKLLARRLDLWHRCFLGGNIYADTAIARRENTLQSFITNFSFTFRNAPITRAEISNRLRQERSAKLRHSLWSVTSQLSAAASDSLLSLIALRNERARALGFPNYYSLSLHLHAIDEAWLLKTLTYLEEQTRAPFREFLAASQKRFHLKSVQPWDFDFLLKESVSLPDKYFPSDSVFALIHRTEQSIGFPVDSLPIKEVVKDIPYGGLSLAIAIPADSRFLVNPTKGKGFYAVAFHEYGHSLKAVHTKVDYPVLKGYEWIPGAQCAAYEEGVADMHGEFTDDSVWLATFANVPEKQVDHYLAGRAVPALYRVRRLLKDFAIEYELYKNPEQDLDSLEHAMVQKYLLAELPDEEPHQLAASIWYTSYPCYYQNYILAGMIATQVQEALTSKFGEEKCLNPKIAEFMIRYLYEGGETLEWTERIRNATGKALEPGAYLRKMGIEYSHPLTAD